MRGVCYSRGLLAVIWRLEGRYKLEVWSLKASDPVSLRIDVWLDSVFPSLHPSQQLVVEMVLEGEAKSLVLWTQLPDARDKCWAVFSCESGKLLRKWEHDLESDVGLLGRPLLRTNGKILLCVARAGRGDGRRMRVPDFRKLALVYSVETGEEIYRDGYEEYQFCRRHDKNLCAVVDVAGNCYLGLQGFSKKPFIEIFNPVENAISRRRISLGTLFPPSKRGAHRDFYSMDLDPVADSIYCVAYYQEPTMVARAFTKLPLRSMTLTSRPLRPPAPQILQSAAAAFDYDPLTLGYWGYRSDQAFGDDRSQLGVYEYASVSLSNSSALTNGSAIPAKQTYNPLNPTLKSTFIPAYGKFQALTLDSGDDGILLLRSKVAGKDLFFVLCFDDEWKVPGGCGIVQTLADLEKHAEEAAEWNQEYH